MKLSYGSVCSGIEAATVAWEPLGWEAKWFSEIMPFQSAVLKHHWPSVENLGDMTKIRDRLASCEVFAPDILVGGTPCQAFSVAGARESLNDERGQLTLEYVRLLNAIDTTRSIFGKQPAINVWENVPGVLSTDDNAFGCFLAELAGADCELFPSVEKPISGKSSKYWTWSKKHGKHIAKWSNAGCVFGPQRAVAWRILDAQYFGVPQRRRRVFVVASARKGFDPSKVLFESEGVRRDTAPSRSEGQGAASHTTQGFASSKQGVVFFDRQRSDEWGCQQVASTISARDKKGFSDLMVHVVNGTQDPLCQNDVAFPLGCNQGQENAVLSNLAAINSKGDTGISQHPFTLHGKLATNIVTPTELSQCLRLRAPSSMENSSTDIVMQGKVRRFTPIECERLQGFPDNHTKIPYRGKDADQCPDGPRYEACGNSMAVPVMHWIGLRIEKVLQDMIG